MHDQNANYLTELKSIIDEDPLGVLYSPREIEAVGTIAGILENNGVNLGEDDLYIILDFFDEKILDYRSRLKVSVTDARTEGSTLSGKFILLRTGQQIAEYFFTVDEKRYEITSVHKSRTEIKLLESWGEDMGRELSAYYDERFPAA